MTAGGFWGVISVAFSESELGSFTVVGKKACRAFNLKDSSACGLCRCLILRPGSDIAGTNVSGLTEAAAMSTPRRGRHRAKAPGSR
jgi:hypothetical protein